MASGGNETGQNVGASLEEILKDAEDAYSYLKNKRAGDIKAQAILVGIAFGVGSLIGLGIMSTFFFGGPIFDTVAEVFGASAAIGFAGGILTYVLLKRREFKFAQLGETIAKVKAGPMTAEDGVRLMDSMQMARLAMKKAKMDSAFSNGVAAFFLVGILSLSAGFGFLAGTMVYLYFRYEALREYEKEDLRYQESRREILQSL